MPRYIMFIYVESYFFTLALHLSHGNTLLSEHIIITSLFSACVIMIFGFTIATIINWVSTLILKHQSPLFIIWAVSIAAISIILISGADSTLNR